MLLAVIIIVAIVVILLIAVPAGLYNGLAKARNQVDEAYSTMDVYLKKRYDLIPNLVETVKGYAEHESATLAAVISARQSAMNAGTPADKLAGEAALSGALKDLFAVAEAYPDLKASQNFNDLQNKLTRVEEDIANARKYYNATVRTFNNKIDTFPSNICAWMFHFDRRPYYEVASEAERQNVRVSF